ncbi:MAG: TonB-dependent receptor [Calditrichaeota bacterium]|nr:MAG: TonB-dependent receptor [Calditrichota bacterium]
MREPLFCFNSKIAFWVLLFTFISAIAYANTGGATPSEKPKGTIKGVVIDEKSQKPLPGVNITVEGTRRGTTTNENGEFKIPKLNPGQYTLIFDYIGYKRFEQSATTVTKDATTDLKTIALEEQAIPLREIIVTPGSYAIMGSESSVRQTLTSEDIKIMGWAEDITRAVQRIPGISSTDYSAKFKIRGGDVDEALVLLDGMQIYKPFHQKDFGGGLFSTVDIEALQGVDLLTGGFTADYGDRMSGVLDMKTKTATANQRKTSLGFSLMNVRLFSMGTFKENQGSWLVSARRGYLDILNNLMKNEFKLEPKYYDILGKVDFKLNDKQRLSAHVFISDDVYKMDESVIEKGKTVPNIDFVDTKYGSDYGWLTLKSLFSPRLFARSILYSGRITKKRFWNVFDDDPNYHLNMATIDDDREFQFYGLKQDWSFDASDKLFLKWGLDVKALDAKYNYFNTINNEFIAANNTIIRQVEEYKTDTSLTGKQLGFYLSSRIRLFSPLTLETGVRYDHSSHTDDKFWSPRVGLIYALGNATFLRAGWGHFYQMQGIDDMQIQYKENFYNPAQLAEHFVVGFEHHFNNGIQFRAEGYQKNISDMPTDYYSFANIDEFFPEARDDLITLTYDKATARGLELYLKYDTGNKFSWWLSYVLSEANDEVTNIDYAGRLIGVPGTHPRAWDQRHTVNFDVNYRPNRRWHFNFAGQYRSGWPQTPFEVQRLQRDDGTFAYYHDYGQFYSTRYPAYNRLDTRINRHFYTSRGKVSVFLHVINVLNHENIDNYDHEILESDAATFRSVIEAETYFPIIPFLGVSWEF